MTSIFDTTRRTLLAGGAALAAVPLLAAVPALASATVSGQSGTPIGTLWTQAEGLAAQMHVHGDAIAATSARTGLPGWMHFRGEVNALGNKRYETLVRILNAKAATLDDLSIQARAIGDSDIQLGPKSWAHAQFDRAARDYHMAA